MSTGTGIWRLRKRVFDRYGYGRTMGMGTGVPLERKRAYVRVSKGIIVTCIVPLMNTQHCVSHKLAHHEYLIHYDSLHLQVSELTDVARALHRFLRYSLAENVHPCLLHHCIHLWAVLSPLEVPHLFAF